MKNCFFYRDNLKAYTDGELSPLRRALVHRHLTHCASCQEEITFMTQVTEDLRASEPEDALSPALREKLLAEPTPPQAATLPKREGEEANAIETPKTLRPPVSGGPLRSKEVGSRRLPAWTFAALAVVAWFVCFPMFQAARENSRRMTSPTATLAERAPVRVAKAYSAVPPAGKPFPSPPPDLPSPVSAPPAPPMAVRAAAPADVNGTAPMMTPPMPASVMPPKMPPTPLVAAGNFGPRLSNAVTAPPDTDLDSLRQVHKEAGIGLQVTDPDATGDKLNDMVKETGGYVAANNLTTDPDGRKSGELIVKVPEVQFETFLAQVAKLGTVVSKNITGEDITEKTSDAHEAQGVEESDLEQAEARLKALGSHAKWEDKEDTQDQRVRLAQTRARLTLLKRMAALGTITIDLSQPSKAAAAAAPITGGFVGTLQATTHDALQSLAGSAAALLALVIWLLAYSPIWVPLLLLGRYALKEYKKREAV